MQIISIICSLVALVCWILTLVKIFQNEGVVQGIVGIICGLYALIIGLMRMKEWNTQPVMITWLIATVVGFIANMMIAAASV